MSTARGDALPFLKGDPWRLRGDHPRLLSGDADAEVSPDPPDPDMPDDDGEPPSPP